VPDLLAEDNIALESAVGMETPANFLDKKKYSLHPRAGGTTGRRRIAQGSIWRVNQLPSAGSENLLPIPAWNILHQ
jgi:hypothetical protein